MIKLLDKIHIFLWPKRLNEPPFRPAVKRYLLFGCRMLSRNCFPRAWKWGKLLLCPRNNALPTIALAQVSCLPGAVLFLCAWRAGRCDQWACAHLPAGLAGETRGASSGHQSSVGRLLFAGWADFYGGGPDGY